MVLCCFTIFFSHCSLSASISIMTVLKLRVCFKFRTHISIDAEVQMINNSFPVNRNMHPGWAGNSGNWAWAVMTAHRGLPLLPEGKNCLILCLLQKQTALFCRTYGIKMPTSTNTSDSSREKFCMQVDKSYLVTEKVQNLWFSNFLKCKSEISCS